MTLKDNHYAVLYHDDDGILRAESDLIPYEQAIKIALEGPRNTGNVYYLASVEAKTKFKDVELIAWDDAE